MTGEWKGDRIGNAVNAFNAGNHVLRLRQNDSPTGAVLAMGMTACGHWPLSANIPH
ncbi:hypothetical protein [Streptomyces pacificus]|uniref:Uncharacterized protein n=1 Tax=Streptomyces pacificus TaxID=2705029 RepID=A0A6A0B4W4_9ACTN|nr:hypothetical protein [Streptomyces pacificus]GFH39528.1 hypothetical protein SCWH03_57960 [Streptomyces pacificus]